MRRLLILAATVFLCLAFAGPVRGAHISKSLDTLEASGDSTQGTLYDRAFYAQSHEMYAYWSRGDSTFYSSLSGTIDTHALPDLYGHKICVQIAWDWRVPTNYNHHDSRVLRNCDPNSHLEWNFSEGSVNDDCFYGVVRGWDPCSSPMGRVQFGRYVPFDDYVSGYRECRAMAGISLYDACDGWNPICNPGPCRMKIRHADGTVEVVGSTHPLDPNS
jgi:hypothetical protein